MKTMTRVLALTALSAIVLPGIGAACVGQGGTPTQPAPPPPSIWTINHGDTDGDGKAEVWVGIEVGTPFSPTGGSSTCACGLGLTNGPPSLAVVDVMVGLTDTRTDEFTELAAFAPLSRDPSSDNGFANGTLPNTIGTPMPGAIWTGFTGEILPFTPPALGANEVWKLWFELEVEVGELQLLNDTHAQFGSGSTDQDEPNHPVTYFTAENSTLSIVPLASTPALLGLGLGMLGLATARRRKAT